MNNIRVKDVKPSNQRVRDVKPNNSPVGDFKPKMEVKRIDLTDQLFNQVLTVGMYVGIPPFTYPELGTVSSSFTT